MRVALTPSELATMLVASIRDDSGMIQLEIPDGAVENHSPRLILANPQLVRYGKVQIRLTGTEHAVVRYVLSNGTSEFGDVIEGVWLGKPISDKTVTHVCSNISRQFLDAGIPYEVSSRGGFVCLESLD